MSEPAWENTLPALLAPGTVIGEKYRIEHLIAEGGMGMVYAGWHMVFEQPIAIKVVRPEFAHQEEACARFLNEARSVARLRGLHVAHVLDTGRIESGPPFMVLEFLEGRDLRTLLEEEGPLSLERTVSYVLEACEALAEAHALGLVHRDLKPENLFLTRLVGRPETIKLIDFGVSKRLDPSARSYTAQGESVGSPLYMSPEQMSAPERVDARSDIWSLGIVLFELLTRRVPFDGESLPAACANVIHAAPPSLSELRADLPPEFEAVVLRCLEKDPADRYADVSELALALLPFVAGAASESRRYFARPFEGPISATPASATRRVQRAASVAATGRKSQQWGASLTPLSHTRRPQQWLAAGALALLTSVGILSSAGGRRLDAARAATLQRAHSQKAVRSTAAALPADAMLATTSATRSFDQRPPNDDPSRVEVFPAGPAAAPPPAISARAPSNESVRNVAANARWNRRGGVLQARLMPRSSGGEPPLGGQAKAATPSGDELMAPYPEEAHGASATGAAPRTPSGH